MKFIHNRFGKYYSEKLFSGMFILWFLLFPFDAHVLPFSIGFMTLYPELLLSAILLFYSFTGSPLSSPLGKERFILSFFGIWLLYGLVLFPFVPGKKMAFYEIRCLVLMAVYAWILLRARRLMGTAPFFSLLNRLSSFLFIFLTVFGLFEFFTGIHVAGEQTKILWNYPAGMHTYAPLFLLDNRNTFLCYLLLFAVLILLSAPSTSAWTWKMPVIICIVFFFSVAAESKFGKMASALLLGAWIVLLLKNAGATPVKKYAGWAGICLAATVLSLATKEMYLGPMWKNGEHYLLPGIDPAGVENGKLVFYSPDSLVKQFGEEHVIRAYREYQMKGKEWAVDIRKNLLLNGWDLFKQSGWLGVGPAQFRWYHEQHKVQHPTTTVTNPHNYLVEIASQYGIIILALFLALAAYTWFGAFANRKNNPGYFLVLTACYAVVFIASGMPSSFLVLNIAWVILPVLFTAPSQLSDKNA